MEQNAEILIVEDSEELLWMMGNVLEHAGFAVDAVTTGEGALKKMREFPEIKVIILNYVLPDMNGLTVLKRLRKSGSQVKVIATSAMKGVSESLVKAGAFTFLEKPFDINELTNLCKQALNGKNSQPGIASQN